MCTLANKQIIAILISISSSVAREYQDSLVKTQLIVICLYSCFLACPGDRVDLWLYPGHDK